MLKWSKYTNGAYKKGARIPDDKVRLDRTRERARQHDAADDKTEYIRRPLGADDSKAFKDML